MPTITFDIPDEASNRLARHPDFPTRRRGKSTIRDFYRKVFLEYMDSTDFRLRELEKHVADLDKKPVGLRKT